MDVKRVFSPRKIKDGLRGYDSISFYKIGNTYGSLAIGPSSTPEEAYKDKNMDISCEIMRYEGVNANKINGSADITPMLAEGLSKGDISIYDISGLFVKYPKPVAPKKPNPPWYKPEKVHSFKQTLAI